MHSVVSHSGTDLKPCDCKWDEEQDPMHWGYSCACYDRDMQTNTAVTYRILYPPCAGKMKDWFKRCKGNKKCPYLESNRQPALIRPQRRARGIKKKAIIVLPKKASQQHTAKPKQKNK